MTEAATTLRVGLPVDDLLDLWDDRASYISGVPDTEPPTQHDGGQYTMTWSGQAGKGRVEINGVSESDSLMVLVITGDEAAGELKQVVARFADAVHDVDDVSGASFHEEPHPDASSDQGTGADQPL